MSNDFDELKARSEELIKALSAIDEPPLQYGYKGHYKWHAEDIGKDAALTLKSLLAEAERLKGLKLEVMDKLADALIRAEKSETALTTTQLQLEAAVEALEGLMAQTDSAVACPLCTREECGITHIPPRCKPKWHGRKEQ